mgnify:CR=1 FL=1
MQKSWISLGLMSGTSGDGVDASIVRTNGINEYELIKDKYFEYDLKIYKDIHNLKEKIHKIEHLEKYKDEINNLERNITIFHAEIIKQLNISEKAIVGFHGQTIYHNPEEKISRQLGNGKLLNQLVKKDIVFDFRGNDILNGGQGAPLTPVFHHLISLQNEIILPVCSLNIGGIANLTWFDNEAAIIGFDTGPGNALMDDYMRRYCNAAFDENGEKLLYYKQKLLELYGVLPGEAVPVLTKGIITVAESGVAGTPTAGAKVYLGTGGNVGKFTTNSANPEVGICLGSGDRDDVGTNPDYFLKNFLLYHVYLFFSSLDDTSKE